MEYLKALRINPNYPNTHNQLGLALAGKGNLDAAIREYREALQITPNDKGVNDILERALAPHLMHPSEIH